MYTGWPLYPYSVVWPPNCCLHWLMFVLLWSVRKEMVVGGYTLQTGAQVIYNTYSLHMDTDYWDDPQQFRPDRSNMNSRATMRHQFNPQQQRDSLKKYII